MKKKEEPRGESFMQMADELMHCGAKVESAEMWRK